MLVKAGYSVGIIILAASIFYSQGQTSQKNEKQKVKAAVSPGKADDASGLIEGKVVKVNDGDNIDVAVKDGKVYAIRLLGIDAPEIKQSYGKKAGKKLADQLEGKDVKVIVNRKEASGNYIGSVYQDGKDISLRQIENGLAWYFRPHASIQTAEDRSRYSQAELVARAKSLGLWEDKNPVPPWVFRGDPPFVENQAPTANSERVPGRKYILGPRGGCYYVGESGSKVYVKDKSLCSN